ncbi:MAG: DMT family transporter [Rhodothalassiaceae bacterium]
MPSAYAVLAVLAGSGLAVQAVLNARVGAHLGGPVWAALISFVIGLVALAGFLIVQRGPLPVAAAAKAVPWFAWAGGLFGAFFVAVMAGGAPRLGVATLLVLVICGQLITAVLLDHFGILQAARPVTGPRLAGVALLIAGAVLVTQKPRPPVAPTAEAPIADVRVPKP